MTISEILDVIKKGRNKIKCDRSTLIFFVTPAMAK